MQDSRLGPEEDLRTRKLSRVVENQRTDRDRRRCGGVVRDGCGDVSDQYDVEDAITSWRTTQP